MECTLRRVQSLSTVRLCHSPNVQLGCTFLELLYSYNFKILSAPPSIMFPSKFRDLFTKYYNDESEFYCDPKIFHNKQKWRSCGQWSSPLEIPILPPNKDAKQGLSYATTAVEIRDDKPASDYPVGVYFVLASKFFESFAANGVRSILALYLYDSLHFSRDLATIVLHIFNFFSQFCPIFGAFIADGYIGNERWEITWDFILISLIQSKRSNHCRSIFCFMIVYSVGFLGITLTTLPIVSQGDAVR